MTWIRGDALNARDVLAAANGCSVIVHAVNPPGYRRWAQLVLPMLDNTIAAAVALGATIVLPGTVYNFGPDAFPVLHEDIAAAPRRLARVPFASRWSGGWKRPARRARGCSSCGRVTSSGRRRATTGSRRGCVKPGQPVKAVSYPGRHGVGHQWSYLPDVARTMVELLRAPGFARSLRQRSTWPVTGTPTARRCARRSGAWSHARTAKDAAHHARSLVAADAGLAIRHHVSRNARDALPVARTDAYGQRPIDSRARARAPHTAG